MGINICEITMGRHTFGAFDTKDDAKRLAEIVVGLQKEIKELQKETSELKIELSNLTFLEKNLGKTDNDK